MIEARDWPLRIRAVRKVAGLLYRSVGIQSELLQFPYAEAFHATQSIHIHVPKAAGNSARRIVYGVPSRALGGHVPAQAFRDASPALYERYFVFASVRQPLARMHSAFHYLRAGGMSRSDRQWGAANLSEYTDFRAFVLALKEDAVRNRILRYVHFIPQSHYVCDADGRLMVNQVIRAEEFEAGMRLVCAKLGMAYFDCRTNPSASSERSDWNDPELEAICRTIYPNDYAVLGY